MGVIDGNGIFLRSRRPELTHRLHGLVVRDSEEVLIEGLVFRDCVDWNLHIHRSADIEVRGFSPTRTDSPSIQAGMF
jgi:hypothetical protein